MMSFHIRDICRRCVQLFQKAKTYLKNYSYLCAQKVKLMEQNNLKAALSVAIRAALAAGRDILEIYNDPSQDFGIERKADNSPLTLADKAAHRRIADMMISFPGIILAIAIAGVMGGSLVNAMIAMTIVTWTKYARLARSMVLKIKRRDFVEAAVVNGGTPPHILWTHIVPNILPLMVITAAADIGAMLMELAGLSFLGFGSQPPAPEWGLMLSEGRQQIQTAPWLMIFPGLAIFVTVVVFNLWGDSLRDVLDPRQDN